MVRGEDGDMMFVFSGKEKSKGKASYKEWVNTQAKGMKNVLLKRLRHECRLKTKSSDGVVIVTPPTIVQLRLILMLVCLCACAYGHDEHEHAHALVHAHMRARCG